jgi:SAM-dependent methyltransferase
MFHNMSHLLDRMRQDWDARAKEDAKYYITCQRRNQDDAEFEAGAAGVLARIRRDYAHLPLSRSEERVFLEIGCGNGRLMRALAGDCGLIHGVDISPEMVRAGRERLAHLPQVRFHVARNNDLSEIPDASVDLIYSYAVFQHLPDNEFVHRYLDEAWRVLKPGGVFTGHFNGAPTVPEFGDTWVGVGLSEGDLLARCSHQGWRILSSEGADSLYLWLTMRKPLPEWLALENGDAPSVTLHAAERPNGGSPLIAGGPQGFASLYISGLPEHLSDLARLSVTVGEKLSPIRYIGPILPNQGRQINVQIIEDTPIGSQPVVLRWRSQAISNAFEVQVQKMEPRRARLVAITDQEEIYYANVIRSGVMQINLDGCQDIASLRTTVDRRLLAPAEVYCVDPLAGLFKANYPLPQDLRGELTVQVEVDGERLSPCLVRIAGPGVPRPPTDQQRAVG